MAAPASPLRTSSTTRTVSGRKIPGSSSASRKPTRFSMPPPDPQIFLNQYLSWETANKENKWQGRNVSRWQSKEYDTIYKQAEQELDAVKRAAMYIKLNDMVVGDNYIQPIAARSRVSAVKGGVTAHFSGWDSDLWQLANWYRET